MSRLEVQSEGERVPLLGGALGLCAVALFLGVQASAVALGGAGATEENRVGLQAVGSIPQQIQPQPAVIGASTGEPKGQNGSGTRRVSVLVHFSPALARECQERVEVRTFAAQCGSLVRYEYGAALPNVINLRDIPESDLAALRQMPGVARVEEDVFYPNLIKMNDAVPLIHGLQSQIAAAGLSVDGSGIRVCIADTGIDMDHMMYADRIDVAASRDFANNDANPDDDNGHGSHVAGIAVGGMGLTVDFGCGMGAEAFQGIAPGATLIGAKILNAFGGGFSSDIIAGIDHCADQSPTGGRADVINLSIGTGQFTGACAHPWAVAANNAVANGVVVVAASGNDGFVDAVSSPACGSEVIAVGATYDATFPVCSTPSALFNWGFCIDSGPVVDEIICFSNQSSMIDVTAPGCDVFSASNVPGGAGIDHKCGTSMASPAVAGLAALILSADATLPPAAVRQIIRDGAVDLGAPGFDPAYGFGQIDVVGSLQLVTPPPPPPPPGCTADADCDDGLFCNGAEFCGGGVCRSGTPPSCDDGVACTADSCDVAIGVCMHMPSDAPCDNGLFCDGAETCHATLGCQAGLDPCGGQGCDEATGVCLAPPACNNDSMCDVGEDCTTCPGDCFAGSSTNAVCGNGICEAFDRENCKRCPEDCSGTERGAYCCGDGGDGDNPVSCGDARCTAAGFQCIDIPSTASCCGDLICEGAEDGINCAIDCGVAPFCGDGFCDSGEEPCNCAADCGMPQPEANCADGADNDCDGFIDCNDADCDADPACTCLPKKAFCTADEQCCSGVCRLNKNECR